MLLAGFVAFVVLLTVVVVNLSGRLRFIRFNVEFEGQKGLPGNGENSGKKESLPEPPDRKQIP